MESRIIVLLLPVVAGTYVVSLLIRYVASPLRSVGGPLLARFTDGWYFWRIWSGNFQADNQELHNTYGPIVRYGPNRYSVSDPEATKTIYGHGTQFKKSTWYSAWMHPGQWTLFSDDDIKRHSHNRKQYQHAYSMSSLVNYEPYVDECAELFRQRLIEIAHGGLEVNMGHWLQCYAFDVIGMMTYSKRLGFLDRGEDVGEVISALEVFLPFASLAGLTPSVYPYLFALKNWWGGSKSTGRAHVANFTRERIAEHQANPKAQAIDEKGSAALDFLSKFYSKHTQDTDGFTSYHVIAGCTANMVAGSDTTAISLSACLYYLLKYPKTFSKLRGEVDELRRQGRMSRSVKFKDTQEMPYLQAVIKEALRMHPATGLPLERVVPKGGATICDRFFPEGTIVGLNSWVEHRNPDIWGADADEFRPERWLIDDSEKLAFMNRHWMPFGLGSRNCLGRHISHLEISKLIPCLVGDFDFELCGPLADPKRQWAVTNYWFVKPRDFMVRVKLREA